MKEGHASLFHERLSFRTGSSGSKALFFRFDQSAAEEAGNQTWLGKRSTLPPVITASSIRRPERPPRDGKGQGKPPGSSGSSDWPERKRRRVAGT